MEKSKVLGQVYTPEWIVDEILNEVGYCSDEILQKYIIEPACGDGAFLCQVVKRYIFQAKKNNFSNEQITQQLQTYVYGVEIDKNAFEACIENLNKVVKAHLSEEILIKWNVFNENTLYFYKNFIGFFDFVVGNPPYIRIHHLDEQTSVYLKQNFKFSVGVIDIYLAFFELGFKLLKSNGKLGYITPNSFLHNTSYKLFREFLQQKRNVKTLIDFKSNKVFKGFSTYTAITIIDKAHKENYIAYKEQVNERIVLRNNIKFDSLNAKKWAFSGESEEVFLKELFENKPSAIEDFFDVQYGFATLRDKIFIGKKQDIDATYCRFNGQVIEQGLLKKIVKGSRYKAQEGQIQWILFPYQNKDKKYRPILEEDLKNNYPKTYAYFLSHKEELEKRDMEKGSLWYEFGRSQGVQSIHQEKIVVNNLINDKVYFYKLPADVLVYSGIFIVKNKPFSKWEMLEMVLSSEDFYKYIRITGKDFSGGYKSISSKQIKEFRVNDNNPNTLF